MTFFFYLTNTELFFSASLRRLNLTAIIHNQEQKKKSSLKSKLIGITCTYTDKANAVCMMDVKDKHDASSLRHYGPGFTRKPSVVS